MNYEVRNQKSEIKIGVRGQRSGHEAMGWREPNSTHLCQSVAKKYIFVPFVEFVAQNATFAIFAIFAVSVLRVLRGSILLEYRLKTLILPSLLESFSLCD
ncbi:hypothetical protein SE18_22840 [Herpetosiphon geysericola]|uniref:Uncharacterized protein n=1 Tax=Herpetosiphon geysericola TaxID=70996 RepID=A0A0P6XYB0_9CHLR|nr:hypothetical protein SE18_22840 [Herpetosiphon geysericola]